MDKHSILIAYNSMSIIIPRNIHKI